MANGVDDPEGTDPASIGDLALFGAARSGSTSAADELRDRYRQALRTVAAGYRNRDTDREALIDQVVGMLDAAPMPTSDGGVPLTLFALVRTARLDEAVAKGRPAGLVDLVGAHGAATLVAGTDAARRKALLGAYASLDDRDRVLLWFSAVEGTMPKALSGRLAIGGADMASTKTFRARSHLRHAYAERRTAGTDWPAECKGRAADLARQADGEQSRAAATTDAHVASCPRCTALLAELHGLTSGLLDEAALVLGTIDAQRVRGRRAGVAAPLTAVAAATTTAPIAAPVGDFDELPPFDDEEAPGRGRAFAVAGIGLLVAAAIAAFVIWGAGGGDNPTHVASPGTTRVLQVSVTTPAPTASVKSATTSTSTTRRHTTTTTTRPSTTRRHSTCGSGGGGWTPPTSPPPSDSTAPTTVAPTSAPTTKPPTTTVAPTTSVTSTTVATSTPDDTGTP